MRDTVFDVETDGLPPEGMARGVAPGGKDSSDPALLRAEAPLQMPPQSFATRITLVHEPRRRGYWVPRAAVVFGAALLTAAFGYELHSVLSSVQQMTPLQFLFFLLSTFSFGWIAFGTLSAAMGFLPLFADEKADTLDIPPVDGEFETRTALLFPVYHEDPARIAGTIAALAEELSTLGKAQAFDVFVLSDTRGETAGSGEEAAYADLKRVLAPQLDVYYRRRLENKARKAGNIKDWVERFGGAYEHFIILDADSIMSGQAVVRLALAMQTDPRAGLIQTAPRLVGGETLLQRLIQFASNIYGPAVAAGLASWHRDQGNYWGHNAIIRTEAFAGAAGLPELPGKPPFGGHIQSHDFVEAVLLQRAGWGVHMAPTLTGSFEGLPPSLADLVVRDRRWAQGNLQHMAIVTAPGLTTMGRAHLAMGALSYVISLVWAASLGVGVVLALQGQQMIPSYFQDSKTLFPIWPIIDPGAAMRLFLATMAVVLLPKALGLVLEIKRAARAKEMFGLPRAFAGVAVETFFSMLLAPILMMTQTAAVLHILFGRDSGWTAQRRDGESITLTDAFRFHWRHTLAGTIMAIIAWEASPGLLFWMLPVVAGLILSAPLHWYTARPASPAMAEVLSTIEEREPMPILTRVARQTRIWSDRLSGKASERAAQGGLLRAA